MTKNIAFQVSGRLGNQLFEWSYAHELAAEFGCKVRPFIDDTHFSNESDSIFTQKEFQCAVLLSQNKRNSIGRLLALQDKFISFSPDLGYSIGRLLGIKRQRDAYLIEDLDFQPRIITGFYVNANHVKKHSQHLFEHIIDKFASEQIEDKLFTLLGDTTYQAIHVRRGDFVQLKNSFGLLGSKWYKDNLDKDKPLVMATDDLYGSKDLIKELSPDYVLSPYDWTPWETLGVLAHAQKLIMANSTFSWWAGFCSVNYGNSAIFPMPFYKSEPWKNEVLHFDGFLSQKSTFEF